MNKEIYQKMCRIQSRLEKLKSDFQILLGDYAKEIEKQEKIGMCKICYKNKSKSGSFSCDDCS